MVKTKIKKTGFSLSKEERMKLGRQMKGQIKRGDFDVFGKSIKSDNIKGWKDSSETFSDGSKSIEWKSKYKKLTISQDLFNGKWNIGVTSLRKNEPPQLMADTNNTKQQAFKKSYEYMRANPNVKD